MRINFAIAALAITGLVATSAASFAQDTKGDTELPEGAQVGPRVGAAVQPGQGEQPKTETVATHGAWQVQCTELPKEQGGKSCGMIQNVKNDKDERVGLSIVVSRLKRDGKTATFMRVLAPIGVYLPNGIPVEIDGAALPNRLPFLRCAPRACEGFGEPNPETLNKFKKGSKATFYLYAGPGNGIPLAVSLEGFGAALAELDKL